MSQRAILRSPRLLRRGLLSPSQSIRRPVAPLSPTALLVRSSLSMVAAILLGLVVTLTGLSQVQHLVAQQELRGTFTDQLAAGTAPVSEGDFENVLLRDGDPVARLEIPSLGVDEIIVEGTTSATLANGPGHRRDSVLPGQAGVSVVMGRAAAYGGPFGRIGELPAGALIRVRTGQGEQIFSVIGVRRAGDLTPNAITADQSRLVLVTAGGSPFIPSGLVRVDADLVSTVQAPGQRQTSYAGLSDAERELGIDLSTVWALVFALQFLIVAEIGAGWAVSRFGLAKAWAVIAPVLLLSGVLVADQVIRLLPNLL